MKNTDNKQNPTYWSKHYPKKKKILMAITTLILADARTLKSPKTSISILMVSNSPTITINQMVVGGVMIRQSLLISSTLLRVIIPLSLKFLLTQVMVLVIVTSVVSPLMLLVKSLLPLLIKSIIISISFQFKKVLYLKIVNLL